MDSIRLELLKNKDEHAQSAIASQEVREHLAGFIRSKRLGSSTQISSIASQSQQALPKLSASSCVSQTANQTHQARPGQSAAIASGGQSSSVSQENDDHPLRKTASMPTMHIPYKAQSLSRRRQMERRTTLSPLMKRKSRPKRPLLHSLDSKAAEYSSNPCIIMHSSGASLCMSLSQSSSPPPRPAPQPAPPPGQQQASVSSMDGYLAQNLLADSPTKSSSQSNLDQRQASAVSAANSLLAADTVMRGEGDEEQLKQQQHLRVQEAIRKTVIGRASSKNKMAAAALGGGSLDSETSSSKYSASLLAAAAAGSFNAPAGQAEGDMALGQSVSSSSGLLLGPRNREELRQWSLDGADLRTGGSSASRQAAANRTLAWGLFNRLRLATTTDAATLRRSQSPSSSISMGLAGGPALQMGANQQQLRQPAPGKSEPVAGRMGLGQKQQLFGANRHQSSSSSSNSSLFSGQDSLEDSSSQAIDLSSSSEATKQRNQLANSSSLFGGSGSNTNANNATGESNSNSVFMGPAKEGAQLNRLNYQKVLQDSFNQLQLCQGQEGIKRILLPAHSIETTTLRGQMSQQAHQHQMPGRTEEAALSLDVPAGQCKSQASDPFKHQSEFLASLAEQFNLSASAHNLISMQEQQQQQQHHLHLHQHQQQLQFGTLIAQQQQQQDLNDLLLAYNSLVQSSEFQHANQINSSLLSKMASLPEPYKSGLLAQLIQQQQHEQNRLLGLADRGQYRLDVGPSGPGHHAEGDQRSSSISRALSSPILVASSASNSKAGPSMDVEMPMQAVQFEPDDNYKRRQRDNEDRLGRLGRPLKQQPDEQHMAVDSNGDSQAGQARQVDCFFLDRLGTPPNVSPLACANQHRHRAEASDQFSLDLSLSSASGSADKTSTSLSTTSTSNSTSTTTGTKMSTSTTTMTSTSGFSNASDTSGEPALRSSGRGAALPELARQSPDGAAPLPQVGPLDANLASVSCFSQQDLSKQLSNCTNLLYQPLFNPNSSTGLVYELELCNHKCICNNEHNHPENSFRVLAIWRRLHDCGLMSKCARIEARRASLNELQLCHSPYERIKLRQLDLSKLPIDGLTQLDCGGQGADIDTAWNEEQTPGVARLAVGCVIEAAVQVAKGQLLNAFAIVRPPGHHAEFQQAMGFCFFNSIAIATRVLLTRHQVMRVLIVDWDVHHGNGIQKIFYEDKSVMYISLHRHDKGNFFPGTGDVDEIGSGQGEGFNWNVAWSGETMGDAEYLAAFRSLVMPIARDFNPSMVLVACGFDGACGHPFNFGGYELSPACFGHMTRQLMSLANGRLVLCLEGGYQLRAICDCAESCVRTLLKDNDHAAIGEGQSADQVQESELRRQPNQSAREVLLQLSSVAAKYWPSVQLWRHTIELSALDVANELM